MLRTLIGVGMGFGLLATAAVAGPEKVSLPADYKTTFTSYYEGDRVGNDKQVIRLFANETAAKGASKDGKLPYGSVIVGEIYSVKVDGEGNTVESALGRRIIDKLAAVVVMERGEGFDEGYAEALTVGDWEFAVYSAAGEKLDKDVTACRECHHPLQDKEFLWSYEHLAR